MNEGLSTDSNYLSTTDRSVLASLELNSKKPLTRVAKELRLTKNEVENTLQHLNKTRVMREVPVLDMYRLGYTDYIMYVSLDRSRRASPDGKFVDNLIASRQVSWLAKLHGRYEYGVSIRAPHIREFRNFLDSKFIGLHDLIRAKSFTTRSEFTLFGRAFLSKNRIARSTIHLGRDRQVYVPSEPEQRVLRSLARLKDFTPARLAKSTKLPLSTVQLILETFRSKRIIAGTIYELDLERLGVRHYKILMKSRRISTRFKDNLYRYCESQRNIFYLASNFGEWDYEAGVEVYKAAELKRVLANLKTRFGAEIEKAVTLSVERYDKRENLTF